MREINASISTGKNVLNRRSPSPVMKANFKEKKNPQQGNSKSNKPIVESKSNCLEQEKSRYDLNDLNLQVIFKYYDASPISISISSNIFYGKNSVESPRLTLSPESQKWLYSQLQKKSFGSHPYRLHDYELPDDQIDTIFKEFEARNDPIQQVHHHHGKGFINSYSSLHHLRRPLRHPTVAEQLKSQGGVCASCYQLLLNVSNGRNLEEMLACLLSRKTRNRVRRKLSHQDNEPKTITEAVEESERRELRQHREQNHSNLCYQLHDYAVAHMIKERRYQKKEKRLNLSTKYQLNLNSQITSPTSPLSMLQSGVKVPSGICRIQTTKKPSHHYKSRPSSSPQSPKRHHYSTKKVQKVLAVNQATQELQEAIFMNELNSPSSPSHSLSSPHLDINALMIPET